MNKQQANRTEPTYYAIIPAEVRYCKQIPFGARLLFGEIMALANKSGYCWASNDYFCELYDVHQTTITEWIAELKGVGFIDFTIKGNNRKITVISTLRKKSYNGKSKDLAYGKEKDLNNNTSINNTNNTIQDKPVSAFNSKEYFTNLMKGKDTALSVIGYYTLKRGNYESVSSAAQAQVIVSRNIKVAKRLAVFEKDKIIRALEECANKRINGEPMSYTLETVERWLLK